MWGKKRQWGKDNSGKNGRGERKKEIKKKRWERDAKNKNKTIEKKEKAKCKKKMRGQGGQETGIQRGN